ncbi:hypothetical protein VKS41_005633 [Umbelopsis sp. WA50703]
MATSSGKVYVGHVSSRIIRRDLEELFEKFGRVLGVEIKHGGFAFIDFEDPRDAEDAVRELNGYVLNGDRLLVEISKRAASGEGSGCFLCGDSGHWARDCPDASERGMDVRSGKCFRCGQSGHLAKYCRGEASEDYRREPNYYRRRSPPPYDRRGYGYRGRSRSPPPYDRRPSYMSARTPPEYYRRGRSRSPPRYGRSGSPLDYYSRGRSRTPPGYGRSRSPHGYRSRSPRYYGPSRSPRGYGRSPSPYDGPREPVRGRSPYSRDYPPEGDRSPLPPPVDDLIDR